MAVIKSVKAIECLIPKQNTLAFMSMITHTPEKALHSMAVYAVDVDNRTDKVEKLYRVAFSLFAAPGSSYLFIRDAGSELTSGTPFIKANVKEGEIAKPEDWDFKIDEIGLYAETGLFGRKRIYFVTSHLDAKDIKAGLKKRNDKKTVVVETVYV